MVKDLISDLDRQSHQHRGTPVIPPELITLLLNPRAGQLRRSSYLLYDTMDFVVCWAYTVFVKKLWFLLLSSSQRAPVPGLLPAQANTAAMSSLVEQHTSRPCRTLPPSNLCPSLSLGESQRRQARGPCPCRIM